MDKVNKLFYGEDSKNIYDNLSIINEFTTLPDATNIVKAIQESFVNLINFAGNLGSGLIRFIFVLVVSLMIFFLTSLMHLQE